MMSERISHRDAESHAGVTEDMNWLSGQVIECCIAVHRSLGPGLLESVYKKCLVHELNKRNIACVMEYPVSIIYDGMNIDDAFRADLIVDGQIIIELKSVEKIMPVHKAQTLTYLKLSPYKIGLLINFGETLLKSGIHRFIDG